MSADLIDEGNYLQVYFPYLRETYEFVQVGKVFDRLNRFLEMLHDLRLPRVGHQAGEVAVTRQNYEPVADVFQQYRKPLTSGFPIPEGLIDREGPAEPVVQPENERLLRHFDDLVQHLKARFSINPNHANWTGHERKGKAFVRDGRLLSGGEDRCQDGLRQQPFSLTLRTTHGGRLLLRCASPLGTVDGEHFATVLRLQRAMPHVKICADSGDGNDEYHLSVQSDLLFSPETTQLEEFEHVFSTMLVGAHEMEKTLFEGKDHTETELAWANAEEAKHGSD